MWVKIQSFSNFEETPTNPQWRETIYIYVLYKIYGIKVLTESKTIAINLDITQEEILDIWQHCAVPDIVLLCFYSVYFKYLLSAACVFLCTRIIINEMKFKCALCHASFCWSDRGVLGRTVMGPGFETRCIHVSSPFILRPWVNKTHPIHIGNNFTTKLCYVNCTWNTHVNHIHKRRRNGNIISMWITRGGT